MLPRHEGGRATRIRDARGARGVNARPECLAIDMRWKGQATDLARHVLDAGRQLITPSRRCGTHSPPDPIDPWRPNAERRMVAAARIAAWSGGAR